MPRTPIKFVIFGVVLVVILGIVWIAWPSEPAPIPSSSITLSTSPSSSPSFLPSPSTSAECHNFGEGSLTVGEYTLSVAIADEHNEQVQGLSGCPSLPENSGMYFVYPEAKQTIFWMKDMLIPLDIIWIADGAVVGINANVPPPAPGTPTSDLPHYPSPQAITGVLELNAGAANQLGIEKGDIITNFVRN